MRRAAVLLLVLVAALLGAREAHAGSACFGAGLDPGYLAAFDSLSGPVGAINYPQHRFYREAQSWATRPGENPGHHSEHFHVAACIPNGKTLSGPFRLDLRYTFHNVADYRILSAGMTRVTQQGSNALWRATPEQIAGMQAAMDASSGGAVATYSFSVMTNAPARNGFTEIRGAIRTEKAGPTAIFEKWHFDPRWYVTYNVPGLPDSTFQPSQMALRNRSQIQFLKPDGTLSSIDYHHSGWCGFAGADHLNPDILSDCASKNWKRNLIDNVWSDTADKTFSLYVSDGGGTAFVMIDPNFHKHFDPNNPVDVAACPNIDSEGNCLGQWFWRPPNAKGIICCKQRFPEVTVPASVIASLAPGLHKLVFLSNDAPECEQTEATCPEGVRGEWSNVEILPFQVR